MNIQYVCEDCGSTDIDADTYSKWDVFRQEWVIQPLIDPELVCADCGSTCIREEAA